MPPTGQLARGTVVGRYTVLSLVGRGGMSEVYGAYDPELDRKVALKFLRPRGSGSPASAESRLLREARAIAQISHPNVIAVYDVGTFGDRVFVAIEYVEGRTLGAWLAERPRSRGAIMAVFADAARGLEAAHAKGLIHRDFKPENVLVGADGIVRVMDFGLARWMDDDPNTGDEPSSPPMRAVGVDLTRTGTAVGTPLYMAPEQRTGSAADARADQFSFCVALYEALYGQHPFVDRDEPGSLPSVVTTKEVRPPPPRSTVAAWMRRALLRGLSPSPEARWPSMADLMSALTVDPARTRRRRLAFAAAIVGLVAGLGVARARVHSQRDRCDTGPSRLAGIWSGSGPGASSDPRREVVRAAFLATGVPSAAEVWERTAAGLDRYAADWLRMDRDSCEATHVRGEQPVPIFVRRAACLDERRGALRALVDVLATADAAMMTSAVDAVRALPALDLCADLPSLSRTAEPRDLEVRRRVDDLRRRALVARALHDTGRDPQAIATGRPLLVEARTVGYPPLVAELLEMLGSFEMTILDPETPATLEEAVWLALASNRDEVAARAAIVLAGFKAFDRPGHEGERWAKLANALLDRLGDGHERLRSWLLTDRGVALQESNHLPESLRLLTETIALKRRLLPTDGPDLARTLICRAETFHKLGDDTRAIADVEEARDLLGASYGPNSVLVAQTLSNRGEYLAAVGRPEDALASFRDSLARWSKQVTSDNRFLAYPLTGLGQALVTVGRASEARTPLERALRIREASEPDPTPRGDTEFALAGVLWVEGDRAHAIELAKAARRHYDERDSFRKVQSREVEAWLAHRGSRGR
jgi:tetratricopeptide (TPR) repeat protein/predicted Ser/Thr protein kinase